MGEKRRLDDKLINNNLLKGSNEVERLKAAVLVVDVINDFVTGKFGCERTRSIVPNIQHACIHAVVPQDCVETASEETQRQNLDYMCEMYNAEMTTSVEIMDGGLL